jgi:hypothetical protein
MYSNRVVEFEDCGAMLAMATRHVDDHAVFKACQVVVRKNVALRGLCSRVLSRQRDAMINGHEPVGVGSSEIAMYEDADCAVEPWVSDVVVRRVRTRDMDRAAALFLESIGVRPAELAGVGLVVCGGCLVECALAGSLDRRDAHDMREQTGFDVDMFVTDGSPYKGGPMAYANELESHVRRHPDVRDVELCRRGFCVDVMVHYDDMTCVKMQIVDLGVPASPMQIVSSFDISVAKMFFCPSTARVRMTEDAAYSFANNAIPYDRRYVEDPRYPQRLRKYVDRTGYGLVLDDLGLASARFAKHATRRALCSLTSARNREALCSWLEELGVSDTSVLTMSLLGRHVGKGSCRGYGTKKRVPDCVPVTGTCGRFGLRQVARRGDPLTELHAMFLLSKVLRSLQLIS